MSAPATATTLINTAGVTGNANQWTGNGPTAISANHTSANLTINMVAPLDSTFPSGSYSLAYSAKDSNANSYTCSPSPATFRISNSTSSTSTVVAVSVPPGTYLPSPLTISITLTNTGGGGGDDGPK
jgi:hypothetical protein